MTEEWTKEFNPFNSNKLYAQVYRWREIEGDSPLPAPALVTIDPTNVCNSDCVWCNSKYIRDKNHNEISPDVLKQIAGFLPNFSDNERYRGVEAVCIAGGGEPLLNDYTPSLVRDLTSNGIGVGIVTNGTMMTQPELTESDWIGVSVDAGTPQTYRELKRRDDFNLVRRNISEMARMSEGTTLGKEGQGHGISYKFLLHPRNCGDVYEAAIIAKETGCRNLHIRPYGTPWDKVKLGGHPFSFDDIDVFQEQLIKARELEDETFGVFGVTHKFDGRLRKRNEFGKCNAVLMTGVFEPPTTDGKGFNFGLCCDRRGDKKLTLEDLTEVEAVKDFWGSPTHRAVVDEIDVKSCPRCTYQPHNKIFEKVIQEDNTTYEFI